MAFVKWFTTYFMYNNLREQFIDEGRVTKNLPSRCAHRCLVHTGAQCLLSENNHLQYQRASSDGKGKRVCELVWSKLLYEYI